MWSTVEFVVENVTLRRRLVPRPVEDYEAELSVECPVGQWLVWAQPGDEFVAEAPGGDVTVQVLGVDYAA